MANFDNECWSVCGNPDRTIRVIDQVLLVVGSAREIVTVNYGRGAVGALYGINAWLKELRQGGKQEQP